MLALSAALGLMDLGTLCSSSHGSVCWLTTRLMMTAQDRSRDTVESTPSPGVFIPPRKLSPEKQPLALIVQQARPDAPMHKKGRRPAPLALDESRDAAEASHIPETPTPVDYEALWNQSVDNKYDYTEPAEPVTHRAARSVTSHTEDEPRYHHLEENELQRTRLSNHFANRLRKELQVGDQKKNL